MACASAWISALLARTAERPGRERLINVADESWKIVQHTGLGEWFQSNFKLARQFGVMNLVVLHKLADLQAAGDAGSRAARIAEGLVADASTRIVYHQDESQVPLTRSLLGLSGSEARLISMLSAGTGAVAGRRALVRRRPPPLADRAAADQHRHRDERHAGRGGADERRPRPRRHLGRGDAGADRRRGARWPPRCGCGAASPALLFGGGWPRVGARAAAGVWCASRPAWRTRPRAWPRGARALLPGAAGFYAALALLAARPRRACVAASRAGLLSGWADARRAPGGRAPASCARCTAGPAPAGWRSAAAAGGCSTPSSVTRWWRSGRRSRASRPGWRSRRCSSGTARRSPPRSRPTCWPARWRVAGRSGRCSCSTRSSCRACRARPGRRCAARELGRRARGGVAAGGRRRARPARRRGRRLLGDRRRAAPGAAAVRRGPHRSRDGRGRALGLRAGLAGAL